MDVSVLIDGASVALLAGIFFRLGTIRADVKSVKRRLNVVEEMLGLQ